MAASRGEHQHDDVVVICLQSVTAFEELGLWCDGCLLPAAYHGLYVNVVDGQVVGTTELAGCSECD